MQLICIWSNWSHSHPVISCFIKIQNGFAFLVPVYPGYAGKRPLNGCLICCDKWQEGQHPLTGQCAASFRLLANQWHERRLVTQWRHGCRAMRRSVCNAGASNGDRSLCVQISWERSYPQRISWYHSKGNWLLYNFAANSLYIMKLCSRLLVLYCRNLYERRQI